MASLDSSRIAQHDAHVNGQASSFAIFVEVAPHKWHALDSMFTAASMPDVGDEIEMPDVHGVGIVVDVHGNGRQGTLFCIPM